MLVYTFRWYEFASSFFFIKNNVLIFVYVIFLREVMNILGSIWSCSNCLLHISYEKWKLCICLSELSSKQWSHLDTYVCKVMTLMIGIYAKYVGVCAVLTLVMYLLVCCLRFLSLIRCYLGVFQTHDLPHLKSSCSLCE